MNILNYFLYFFYGERFTYSLSLEISLFIFCGLILRYYYINNKNKKFDPNSIFIKDRYLMSFSLVYIFNFVLGFYGFY